MVLGLKTPTSYCLGPIQPIHLSVFISCAFHATAASNSCSGGAVLFSEDLKAKKLENGKGKHLGFGKERKGPKDEEFQTANMW